MITLTPIYRDDIKQAGREFFGPRFVADRLGRNGYWYGGGARHLHLASPVERGGFESLLDRAAALGAQPTARGPAQSPQPVGWRLTFTTPPRLNAIWAMADRGTGLIIEKVHAVTVKKALDHFERLAGVAQNQRLQWDRDPIPGCAFAIFRTGASANRTPELMTTAFLFNLAVHADGRHATFAAEELARAHKSIGEFYESSLIAGIQRSVGPMSRYSHRDQQLTKAASLLASSVFPEADAGRTKEGAAQYSSKRQLRALQFEEWRRQGEKMGWGPKQAQDYLRILECKQAWARLGNTIRGELQSAVRAVRRTLPSAPPRIQVDQVQPAAQPVQKDHGFTHSH